METLWELDQTGLLVAERVPDGGRVPVLVAVAVPGEVVVASSAALADVGLDGLMGQPPADVRGWEPQEAGEILEMIRETVGEVEVEGGPSYVIPSGVVHRRDIEVEVYRGPDAERLRGRIPDGDLSGTWGPWAVVAVDGEVAAKCSTARLSPAGAEAGLYTYPRFRRRGYGAAATTAWSKLVEGRVAFYSTAGDNVASQGVARHLGLPLIGWWWTVTLRPGYASNWPPRGC